MLERVRSRWQALGNKATRPAQKLLLRCLSVAVLLLVVAAIVLVGEFLLRAVVAVFVLIAGWEWSQLAPDREDRSQPNLLLGALVLVLVGEWWVGERALLLLPLFLPLTLLTQLRSSHHDFVGLVCLSCTGIGMLVLYRVFGNVGFLWTLCVISAFDVFAYLCGRTLKGAKLWPAVSPQKRWTGLVGGLLAASAVSALWGWLTYSADDRMAAVLFFALAGLLVGLGAQVGDLAESQLKRIVGVKDAGTILLGHGGLLDRVDSIIGATPIALIMLALAAKIL